MPYLLRRTITTATNMRTHYIRHVLYALYFVVCCVGLSPHTRDVYEFRTCFVHFFVLLPSNPGKNPPGAGMFGVMFARGGWRKKCFLHFVLCSILYIGGLALLLCSRSVCVCSRRGFYRLTQTGASSRVSLQILWPHMFLYSFVLYIFTPSSYVEYIHNHKHKSVQCTQTRTRARTMLT